MQQIDTITPAIQQLVWLNRNDQKKVLANSQRASNGALIVQQTKIPVGHSMQIGTLDGWMTRADFESLRTHNETNLGEFTLTLNNDTFQVMWDNVSGTPIVGDDLYVQSDGGDYLTNVVLKFLTV